MLAKGEVPCDAEIGVFDDWPLAPLKMNSSGFSRYPVPQLPQLPQKGPSNAPF